MEGVEAPRDAVGNQIIANRSQEKCASSPLSLWLSLMESILKCHEVLGDKSKYTKLDIQKSYYTNSGDSVRQKNPRVISPGATALVMATPD